MTKVSHRFSVCSMTAHSFIKEFGKPSGIMTWMNISSIFTLLFFSCFNLLCSSPEIFAKLFYSSTQKCIKDIFILTATQKRPTILNLISPEINTLWSPSEDFVRDFLFDPNKWPLWQNTLTFLLQTHMEPGKKIFTRIYFLCIIFLLLFFCHNWHPDTFFEMFFKLFFIYFINFFCCISLLIYYFTFNYILHFILPAEKQKLFQIKCW